MFKWRYILFEVAVYKISAKKKSPINVVMSLF